MNNLQMAHLLGGHSLVKQAIAENKAMFRYIGLLLPEGTCSIHLIVMLTVQSAWLSPSPLLNPVCHRHVTTKYQVYRFIPPIDHARVLEWRQTGKLCVD